MTILLHIFIAITSILLAGYTFIKPTRSRLHVSYGLVVATLLSGGYLIATTHAPLVTACTTGLIYITVTLSLLVASQKKLSEN
jgi:hypothetical protein